MFAEAVSGLNAPIFLNNKQSRTTNLTKKQPRSILTNGKKKIIKGGLVVLVGNIVTFDILKQHHQHRTIVA